MQRPRPLLIASAAAQAGHRGLLEGEQTTGKIFWAAI